MGNESTYDPTSGRYRQRNSDQRVAISQSLIQVALGAATGPGDKQSTNVGINATIAVPAVGHNFAQSLFGRFPLKAGGAAYPLIINQSEVPAHDGTLKLYLAFELWNDALTERLWTEQVAGIAQTAGEPWNFPTLAVSVPDTIGTDLALSGDPDANHLVDQQHVTSTAGGVFNVHTRVFLAATA